MGTDAITASYNRPPVWASLEAALRQRRPVQLSYHSRSRTVCPHALGWKAGKAMLLAYQAAGDPNDPTDTAQTHRGWRNFLLEHIDHLCAAHPSAAWESAGNYNPSQPFNSIDHLDIAIDNDPPTHG